MNVNASPALHSFTQSPERILHRLEWKVIRRLDGVLQGDYRTLFYGDGIDFTDLREYQPQDDIRHIDWNVTARTDTLHVRQYIEDREITVWFLLDLSPSMAFGPFEHSKEMALVDLTATLARLMVRSGNRVGAILYRDKPARTIPPRSSRNQVLRLIKDIQRESGPGPTAMTDLNVLLTAGLHTFNRRSLVFVISDFISQPGWGRALSLLNRRHELVGIRLWDPHEVELPDVGLLVVEDAETGEQLYVETGDPVFRRRFYEAAEQRERDLAVALKRAGVDLFDLSTTDDLVPALVRMAAARKKRRS